MDLAAVRREPSRAHADASIAMRSFVRSADVGSEKVFDDAWGYSTNGKPRTGERGLSETFVEVAGRAGRSEEGTKVPRRC